MKYSLFFCAGLIGGVAYFGGAKPALAADEAPAAKVEVRGDNKHADEPQANATPADAKPANGEVFFQPGPSAAPLGALSRSRRFSWRSTGPHWISSAVARRRSRRDSQS